MRALAGQNSRSCWVLLEYPGLRYPELDDTVLCQPCCCRYIYPRASDGQTKSFVTMVHRDLPDHGHEDQTGPRMKYTFTVEVGGPPSSRWSA